MVNAAERFDRANCQHLCFQQINDMDNKKISLTSKKVRGGDWEASQKAKHRIEWNTTRGGKDFYLRLAVEMGEGYPL